jgi:hypothetical protein
MQLAGVIDSGAEVTVLPGDLAPLLRYAEADLVRRVIHDIDGQERESWDAKTPCRAFVPDAPQLASSRRYGPVFELLPCFSPGANSPVWGRRDFLRHFDLTLMERRQQFSITPSEVRDGTAEGCDGLEH